MVRKKDKCIKYTRRNFCSKYVKAGDEKQQYN